jgi:glycosyltransferase involved in cell wall biosynthesis
MSTRPVGQRPATRPLRIAQVAPPVERVPPRGYGGTERIVDELSRELARRGHQIVLFASGDSESPGELAVTVERSLRAAGHEGDPSPWFVATQLQVLARELEFDVIHSHLEFYNLTLARAASRPVIGTFHGRLDTPHAAAVLAQPTPGLVAISRAQAEQHPDLAWAGVVHNGLTLRDMPFREERDDSLCFVGRITPEKGILDAIEVARLTGRRLRVAAKEPWLPWERSYYSAVFMPALERADVELLGELGPDDRDALLSTSHASLMPGSWPEPFGLAAIESLACGTPVICRPVGGLVEIVRDGRDGAFATDADAMAAAVERVGALDRAEIRRSVVSRFSAERMADGYEAIYARMLGDAAGDVRRRKVIHVRPERVATVQHEDMSRPGPKVAAG